MSSGHVRKVSNRTSLRRSTVGPLSTTDDPLSITTSTAHDPVGSPDLPPSPGDEMFSPSRSPLNLPPALGAEVVQKDLSFLLAPSIYHPISQLEVPPPFRVPFPTVPAEASLSSLREQLDSLLSKRQFLPAAHLSASILTSGKVSPTDLDTVFYLLQIRYSCLELTGNTTLAAQEAKALEDLNSAFYFTSTGDTTPVDVERVEEHIMPYSLRLQGLHLQSLGFGDPRRGISSLYDLGLECREQIALPTTSPEDRTLWRKRLQDLGIRVVNALIEMDDLETAKRTLMANITDAKEVDSATLNRAVLLLLKIGDTTTARNLLDTRSTGDFRMLQALLCVAEGRWEDSVQQWEAYLDTAKASEEEPIIKQNLAVALLYVGRPSEVSLPPLYFSSTNLDTDICAGQTNSRRPGLERSRLPKLDVQSGHAL